MSKTSSENGFRVIQDAGWEPPKLRAKNKAKTQAKMFQFMKSKKKGKRK